MTPHLILLSLTFAVTLEVGPPQNQTAAYGLFLEALTLREADRPDEALKVLQRALKADPKAADVHAEIARIQMEQRRFPLAISAVEQAVKVAPSRPDLRSLAGQIHQFYGQSGGGEGELRQAVTEYETAASLDPNDPAPLRDLTRLYSVLRDVKGALATWKRLSEVDPRNVEAFVQVAALSLAQGDIPAATAALETAVRADPQNVRAQQMLGDVKQQAGKPDEALKHYEAAVKADGRDLITRLKMGDLLISAHRGDEALALSSEMLKQDESNRFALDLRARALKELRRVDEALLIAEKLASSDPKDLKAAFLVVTLLEQKGDLEPALEKLKGLVERDIAGEDEESVGRNNRVFWAHTGMVQQRLGRFKEAADAFGEAARSGKETEASLLTYRIDALISAKDFVTALKEARAARLDPSTRDESDLKFLEAYAMRGTGDEKGASALVDSLVSGAQADSGQILAAGEFYQRAKNLDRAGELFSQAALKDPNSVRAVFNLGSVLERQKRYDEAERAFRKALALSPDSAITLNYLGYMNADRNVKAAEALTLIERALYQDPDNGSYLDSLAWALYRLGRTAEAETAIRRALKTQEKNAVVIAHLGLILAKRGDHAEALKYLRLALEGEDEDGELDRALVEETIRTMSRAAQKKP